MNAPLQISRATAGKRLSDAELQALSRWVNESTLPSWRDFTPAGDGTPIDALNQLIGEHTAMRAVLDLVGDFAGDLTTLLQRLNGKE